MANETIGGIKRLSEQVGGDDRWDVNITGGNVDNVTMDSPTITGGVVDGTFTGNLTGDVTGNLTGNVTGNVTGNASTATALQTPRTIGGVSFDGTANIVPQTIQTADDTADSSSFLLFANASGAQNQQPKTNTALTFNATSGELAATSLKTDSVQTTGSSGVAVKNSGGTTVLTVGSANSTNSTFAGAVNINGSQPVTSETNTQTFTNKTINLNSNTLSGTVAQFNTALSDGDFATLAGSETLTNKTVNLSSNTLTGTTAQFNAALSDGDFATLAGAEQLSNKTLVGVTDGSSAAAGVIGEIITGSRLAASASALTTSIALNVTSISLTAGDWDVSGVVGFTGVSGNTTVYAAGISTTSATFPPEPYLGGITLLGHVSGANGNQVLPISNFQVNVSSTTTVYLIAQCTFTTGAANAYGGIRARRIR